MPHFYDLIYLRQFLVVVYVSAGGVPDIRQTPFKAHFVAGPAVEGVLLHGLVHLVLAAQGGALADIAQPRNHLRLELQDPFRYWFITRGGDSDVDKAGLLTI
jgi:hypothetical protein